MAYVSNIVGQMFNYVYTWLPRTAANVKEGKKGSRKLKKRVNFSQPITEKNDISYIPLEVLKSSHGLPSTPTGSKVVLFRSLPNGCEGQGMLPQEFSSCNLNVVGRKFLSSEKKISKRSALKKWLRQRTNVIRSENFRLDEQFCVGGNHDLCFREVFECSPRLAGKLASVILLVVSSAIRLSIEPLFIIIVEFSTGC